MRPFANQKAPAPSCKNVPVGEPFFDALLAQAKRSQLRCSCYRNAAADTLPTQHTAHVEGVAAGGARWEKGEGD